MKGIKKLFLSLLCVGVLTSCNSFFKDKSQTHVIKSIDTVFIEEDGRTQVTITYTDEDTEPVVFYIPKGEKGDEGTGIKNVSYQSNEANTMTQVIVEFTDSSKEDAVINIPNGISITGITNSVDSEGNNIIVVNYSDGTSSSEIIVPKGEKGDKGDDGENGEDGVGITSISSEVAADNTTHITFGMSDGNSYNVTIPAPQDGEDGNGIQSMVAGDDGQYYVITVYYTNGQTEELKFARPKDPSNWSTGSDVPSNSFGKDGDFYFDTYHKTIYVKEHGTWSLIVSFQTDDIKYTVKFDLNDQGDASMPSNVPSQYRITRGMYFDAEGYTLPIPSRPGYEFNGWYRVRVITPVNGAFTDLTPVFSDLVLYANWK